MPKTVHPRQPLKILARADLKANSIQIRTLKRRAERWREVPVPPELLRSLKLVHALRSAPAKIARIIADAGLESPQACPKGLRHGFGIAAVAAAVLLPTIAAARSHANLQITAVCTTAAGLEARNTPPTTTTALRLPSNRFWWRSGKSWGATGASSP